MIETEFNVLSVEEKVNVAKLKNDKVAILEIFQ